MATDLLSKHDCTILLAARTILGELQSAANNAAGDTAVAWRMGRLAQSADTARDSITTALIHAKVFGDSQEAHDALEQA